MEFLGQSIEARAYPIKRSLLILGLLGLGFALRHHLWEATVFALGQLLAIAPLIVIGLVLTAALSATGSISLLASTFKGNQIKMIMLVSLVGAVTPVCGITVLPLVAGLLSAGVPIAPIMAFLLSSPVTDPGMLAITAGTLGWSFAVGKMLAAFGIGILGGGAVLLLVRSGYFAHPVKDESGLSRLANGSGCPDSQDLNWRFWQDANRRGVFRRTVVDTGRLVLTWLTIAFLAEYFLRAYLPPELLVGYVGRDNAWAVPLAAIIGAPIYLDGYAALPLIRGLMEKGMADGAAMAFLIAGGVTSAWAAIPVFALVRTPVFIFYILMAVIGSMLAGWAYQPFAG
ncbi:MAG: permease [Gammaproteobacteria bacterium]|nr:permease [Gammaproteobacteria bacterium]